MRHESSWMTDSGIFDDAPTRPSSEERSIFIVVFEILRRRIWVFLTVVALVFTAAAAITVTTPKRYTASSQIMVGVPDRVLNVEEVVDKGPIDDRSIQTELAILQSEQLAGRVVDGLNLVQLPEFNGMEPGKERPISAMSASEKLAVRQGAIYQILGHLRVEQFEDSYLINISYSSLDPEMAAKIADTIAEQYLAMQLQQKYDALANAHSQLASRIEELSNEVQRREVDVATFRDQEGLLNPQGQRLAEQTTLQLNAQRAAQAEKLARSEARLQALEESLRTGQLLDISPEAQQSGTINALRSRQAELAARRADAQIRWAPNHPGWKQLESQEAALNQAIQTELSRIRARIEEDVRIDRSGLAAIDAQLNQQSRQLTAQNIDAVTLNRKEREAEAARQLNESLLQRYREVIAQAGIEKADAQLTARATVPLGPSSPQTKLNLVLGLIGGVLLGLAAVLLLEVLEQSLRTPEDVQNRLGLPCIGQLPFLDRKTRTVDGETLQPETFVLRRPLSAFGEALRNLRAGIFYSSPDRRPVVVAVTSALPEEGKTTLALSMSRMSALAGSKVILVDCDLRRRSATHAIGLDVERGLTEYLFRTATLDEVIQKDPESSLDVLPLAQAEFTPRDLLGSDTMRLLLEDLRKKYEVVILDCAPVMPLSDTRVLSTLCDSMLFVVRWGKTPISIVRTALQHIRERGAHISGVALVGVAGGMMSKLIYDQPNYYSELYQSYYIR